MFSVHRSGSTSLTSVISGQEDFISLVICSAASIYLRTVKLISDLLTRCLENERYFGRMNNGTTY